MRIALLTCLLWSAATAVAGDGIVRGPFGSTADLAVLVDDGLVDAAAGCPLTWTIRVHNLGPDDAADVTVTDTFPPAAASVVWRCEPDPGASCAPGTETGDLLDEDVFLPAGRGVTYIADAVLAPGASGTIVNSAEATVAGPTVDPFPGNDVGTDADTVVSLTPTGSNAPGLWVVNEGSGTIDVINVCVDQVGASISLPPGAAPRGLAFSTQPGRIGEFAFVGQGNLLHVVRASDRSIVQTYDVETFAGIPAGWDVSLAGLETARVQAFLENGSAVERAYLHAAANLLPDDGGASEAWFLVLDQAPLLGVARGGAPALVGAGPLVDPLAVEADALDVTILAAESGERFQRAWYTLRTADVPPALVAVQVAGARETVPPSWQPVSVVSRTLSPAASPPERAVVGTALPGREVTLLPGVDEPSLTDLHLGGDVCDFGPGAEPIDVAIAGPGKNNLDIVVLDRGNETLRRLDDDGLLGACPTSDVAVGAGPVAMDTLGRVGLQKVYVANRDADTVTVVDASLQVATIPLGTTGGVCVDCPVELKVQRTPATSCGIRDVAVVDGAIEWTSVGCAGEDVRFVVWCLCTESDPADCPPECPAAGRDCPNCHTIGSDDWEELGVGEMSPFPDPTGDKSVDVTVTHEEKPLP